MRSLTLSSCRSSTVQGKKAEARYTALAVRPEELLTTQDNETLYIASERQLPDGGVEIQVFIGNSTEPSSTNTVGLEMLCACRRAASAVVYPY